MFSFYFSFSISFFISICSLLFICFRFREIRRLLRLYLLFERMFFSTNVITLSKYEYTYLHTYAHIHRHTLLICSLSKLSAISHITFKVFGFVNSRIVRISFTYIHTYIFIRIQLRVSVQMRIPMFILYLSLIKLVQLL